MGGQRRGQSHVVDDVISVSGSGFHIKRRVIPRTAPKSARQRVQCETEFFASDKLLLEDNKLFSCSRGCDGRSSVSGRTHRHFVTEK